MARGGDRARYGSISDRITRDNSASVRNHAPKDQRDSGDKGRRAAQKPNFSAEGEDG